MKPINSLIVPTCIVTASAAGAGTNTADLESLGRALGLPEITIQDLGGQYARANTSAGVLDVACLTAKYALGPDEVETAPINHTIVEINWSEACWDEPHCVIQPSTADDVSKSLRIIDFFGVKFSVRSGGHSPNPGWSSINHQGILLDLGLLNSISLSSDSSFASVGPGARWNDVYQTLGEQEAVVVGGRVPSVGVGGLILGGGFFFFSNQFGLAADNVRNFEVVLSDGTIVNANVTSHSDLFWALKGGGPNFGIVTRYDLYTVPSYDVWAQESLYSIDQAYDIIEAFDEWQKNGAADAKSFVTIILALDYAIVALMYSEPSPQAPGVFAPLLNLVPLQTIVPSSNLTFSMVAQLLSEAFPNTPGRHDYRGCTTRIDTQLNKDVYAAWREKALAVHEATGANQTFAIQHVGANMARQSTLKGGNPLNLPSGDMQWWTTLIDWEREEDDDLVRSVSIETTALYEKLGKERGLGLPFIFMNDASQDQNPLASYGSESIYRLKEISQIYDKKQVFQKLQSDGFLLSKI
ncbi:putative fad linked oxidase-like protein [Rosellinia necatrix]|uniref:Putative fad linked oxidase-like protein n=1 Tax=Rosellinia necatrix TaxID=77044 RepID=A0A1S7UV04_ROSNE|nr:putative fad linked oxidase-like protein [Rosellinia necatrix]